MRLKKINMKGGGAKYISGMWVSTQDGIPGHYAALEADILTKLNIIPSYIDGRGQVSNLLDFLSIENYKEGFNTSLKEALQSKNSVELKEIFITCNQALELRIQDAKDKVTAAREALDKGEEPNYILSQGHKYFFLTILQVSKTILENMQRKAKLKATLKEAFERYVDPWTRDIDNLNELMNGLSLGGKRKHKLSNKKAKKRKRKLTKKNF